MRLFLVATAAAFVAVPFEVLRGENGVMGRDEPRLRTRGNEPLPRRGATLDISNKQTYYLAAIGFGSRNETVNVLIDTGLLDLWVAALPCSSNELFGYKRDENDYSSLLTDFVPDGTLIPDFALMVLYERTANPIVSMGTAAPNWYNPDGACDSEGAFRANSSSTFKVNSLAPAFLISYADYSYAYGVWAEDTILLAGVVLQNATFGLAPYTDSLVGVLGIGPVGNEALNAGLKPFTYRNVPQLMKDQGLTERNAYSISLSKDSGVVLFGAYDSSKYKGNLRKVKVIQVYDKVQPSELFVLLNGMDLGSVKVRSVKAALLDTGTTYGTLPQEYYNAFLQRLEPVDDDVEVDCLWLDSTETFHLNFSGIDIEVPFKEMVVRGNDETKCFFSMDPTDDDTVTLGDSFLRSMYAVFDLETMEVALAQAGEKNGSILDLGDGIPASEAPQFLSTLTLLLPLSANYSQLSFGVSETGLVLETDLNSSGAGGASGASGVSGSSSGASGAGGAKTLNTVQRTVAKSLAPLATSLERQSSSSKGEGEGIRASSILYALGAIGLLFA